MFAKEATLIRTKDRDVLAYEISPIDSIDLESTFLKLARPPLNSSNSRGRTAQKHCCG